jgi:lipopolysaccharide transport system ATP-binding protein
VNDGLAGEVVAHYLQTVEGAGSEISWPDLETAPGGRVRLRSVRVVLEDGSTAGGVDVRRPVGIEIGFTVREPDTPIFPKIKLYDREGQAAFNAIDTSSRWHDLPEPGDYVSTAWIPANLMNEGVATVDVDICSYGLNSLRSRAGKRQAVSFHVQDPGDGDSAKGLYRGQWKGVVRPLLEWTTEER